MVKIRLSKCVISEFDVITKLDTPFHAPNKKIRPTSECFRITGIPYKGNKLPQAKEITFNKAIQLQKRLL